MPSTFVIVMDGAAALPRNKKEAPTASSATVVPEMAAFEGLRRRAMAFLTSVFS